MSAETYRGFPRLISQYVTPSTGGDPVTSRLLSFPDNPTIRQALLDVVQMLGHVESWIEEGIEARETVQIFTEIVNQLTEPNPMIGSVQAYITSLPDNVLPCNGTQYNRVDYPDLYKILPAQLIIDPDTFTTPDLTGQTLIGTGTTPDLTTYVLLDTGGDKEHTLSESEIPAHSHTSPPHQHGFYKNLPIGIDLEGIGIEDPTAVSNLPFYDITDPATVTINSTGGSQPHNNMQPYTAVIYGVIAR